MHLLLAGHHDQYLVQGPWAGCQEGLSMQSEMGSGVKELWGFPLKSAVCKMLFECLKLKNSEGPHCSGAHTSWLKQ